MNKELQEICELTNKKSNRLAFSDDLLGIGLASFFCCKDSVSLPHVLILPNPTQAEKFLTQLRYAFPFFEKEFTLLFFPEGSSERKLEDLSDDDAQRSKVLHAVLQKQKCLIVTSIGAVLQNLISPENFQKSSIVLRKSSNEFSISELAKKLLNLGYDNEFEVHVPGEYSLRGGIIDIFSPVYVSPIRVDFFGDEIESIRFFSSNSQRSIQEIDEAIILPRLEYAESLDSDFLDYLHFSKTRFSLIYPSECYNHAGFFFENKEKRVEKILHEAFLQISDNEEDKEFFSIRNELGIEKDSGEINNVVYQQFFLAKLREWAKSFKIFLAIKDEIHRKNCVEELNKFTKNYTILNQDLRTGFFIPKLKILVLCASDFFWQNQTTSASYVADVRDYDADWTIRDDIGFNSGDFVVHFNYGIAIYRGLVNKENDGEKREMMHLEFSDEIPLFVPLSQVQLVSRFVGQGAAPKLSKIGTQRWKNKLEDTEKAVFDFAAELLRIQAVRATVEGFACKNDEEMQVAFENDFPFTATTDQILAFDAVKSDMEKSEPMDRLLCGDVGYGKTEVAIRAAFKAVMNGFQVAIVAPTTILAQQHFESFSSRMANYPIVLDLLSRFKTPAQQKKSLQILEEGKIDIIIGTHRLLQKDVNFANLGLVVIDEEQKFGVSDKEFLKKMRISTDILTMSATPIPRTLYMSLVGARNLSTINTPPHQRLAVKTIVSQYDENLLKDAIERELERNGQVFILHNRVKTIMNFAEKIQKLAPNAKVVIGHGQMETHELENVMHQFVTGNADVLVSTTIVENGVDVPNANTMVIDRADRFGLSELYQIRGRVGRSHRQAYCYLFIPPNAILSTNARERIAAIRKYSNLGAGFKLALRDLEIRGTGNILGSEQSGYIAAVGFELYCEMLKDTINRLKNLPQERSILREKCHLRLSFLKYREADLKNDKAGNILSAEIPQKYISEEHLRIEAYRKFWKLQDLEELKEYQEEISDRFGRLPQSVINLFSMQKIIMMAEKRMIFSIYDRENDDRIFLENARGHFKIDGKIPVLQQEKAQSKLQELIKIIEKIPPVKEK